MFEGLGGLGEEEVEQPSEEVDGKGGESEGEEGGEDAGGVAEEDLEGDEEEGLGGEVEGSDLDLEEGEICPTVDPADKE